MHAQVDAPVVPAGDPGPIERGSTAALLRPLLEAYAARLPVRTVAVVGNAPLEPSADRARQIDAADIVIRCNSFVLDEPDGPPVTGTRTNVCVVAHIALPTPGVFRDYRDRLYLVPQVGYARTIGDGQPPRLLATWPDDLGSIPIPNDAIGLPVIQGMKSGGETRPAVPTSGTLALGLARLAFPEARLVLAGVSFLDATEQRSWRHRYGSEVPVHAAHLLDRERALILDWIEESGGRVLA